MAFQLAPCFDVMELVRQHVVEKRQEITTGWWRHNASNMRLVVNQLKNIATLLEKRGKCITPKQANPKTQYKYVAKSTTLHQGSGCLLEPTPGMHVARPIWGSSTWTFYVEYARYPTAESYIVDKTIECQRNPRLTWATPPRYGCYAAWKARYID